MKPRLTIRVAVQLSLLHCLLFAASAWAAPAVYDLDPVHTRVVFAVEHAGFSQAIGTTGTFYVQNLEEKHVFTPYFGVTYTLSRNFSPYVSYTAIFNPQSAQDVRGRTLDPEQGSNIEAGIKGEWARGRLSASAALFEVKRDNLAVRDGANQAPDGTPAYRAEDDVTGRG